MNIERYYAFLLVQLNRTYDAHMFYFFFEAAKDAATQPLTLWMTGMGCCIPSCHSVPEGYRPGEETFVRCIAGGPGCSSELAVFYEQGPFRITKNLTLEKNVYGWDQTHNMIFVDQVRTATCMRDMGVVTLRGSQGNHQNPLHSIAEGLCWCAANQHGVFLQ